PESTVDASKSTSSAKISFVAINQKPRKNELTAFAGSKHDSRSKYLSIHSLTRDISISHESTLTSQERNQICETSIGLEVRGYSISQLKSWVISRHSMPAIPGSNWHEK
ncbi:MAG: hypothetical protein AAF497_14750, partial [Planctomycetota bacterium]